MRRCYFQHILFLSALFLGFSSHGAPLEDLQNSTEYRGAVRGAKRLKLPAWADPESNYVKLFEGNNSKAAIFKLFGDDLEKYTTVSSRLTKKDEYVVATRVYGFYPSKKGISMSLLIPHPAYLHLVNERLVMEIEAFRPSPADIVSTDSLSIQSDPGEIIVCRDGTTVIIIPLPREAKLIAKASNARDAKDMAKLVGLMNIGEMKRHLNS